MAHAALAREYAPYQLINSFVAERLIEVLATRLHVVSATQSKVRCMVDIDAVLFDAIACCGGGLEDYEPDADSEEGGDSELSEFEVQA